MLKKHEKLVVGILSVILIVINAMVFSFPSFTFALESISNKDGTKTNELEITKLGIGGGGALFEPAISPHDSNEMLVVPDMGGIYITHDKGNNWSRVNLHGTVMTAIYDPSREGVIYAGGSGLYRSVDNGDTFELIYPNPDDVIDRVTHNENGLQYFFTKSGNYDRNKFIKNILIDPNDSNHIFILSYYNKNGTVLESKDNGENFKILFTYTKNSSPGIQWDFNELIYKRESGELFLINDEEIIGYNEGTNETYLIYKAPISLVDVSMVYDNGKTYFVIIEKIEDNDMTDTKIYYTSDFVNKVDFTNKILATQELEFTQGKYGVVSYKWNFRYVSATALDNIYVTNWSYATSSTGDSYPYTIDGIIRYHNDEAKYLYGNPFRNHNYLASRSWNDGCTYALGIAASYQNEEEFIFTTLLGVNYSGDGGINIYPKHTTVIEGVYPNAKYVTNGIDEPCTYALYEDPFNRNNLLLLNTDYGLIRSEDNGQSWVISNNGIPSSWSNTIYDAKFDEYREGVVYSIWSGRHNAPYNPGNETDGSTRRGGFAISYNGGKTWDAIYSSGLPENTIPVKMQVVYNDNGEVTIYLATFNNGFYVSYDSGKNFLEINEGITKVSYGTGDQYQYIYGSDIEVTDDGKIFAITAKNTFAATEELQKGRLYEYIDNKWQEIELPINSLTPRDIYYHDGVLYISGVPKAVWKYHDGVYWDNYGGGVYTYKNGEFVQIFDESIGTTGVQIDSKGTIFISDMNGSIYRKEIDQEYYTKILDDYFYLSKGIQLVDDSYLYLATFGGGLIRIDGLEKLYKETNSYKYYNVVFNSNGGSEVLNQQVLEGGYLTKPSNPVREGYKFIGWTINGAFYDYSSKITSDIELVALWEQLEDGEIIEEDSDVSENNEKPIIIDKKDYSDIVVENPNTQADSRMIMLLLDFISVLLLILYLLKHKENKYKNEIL